jgi:hypothetical protein
LFLDLKNHSSRHTFFAGTTKDMYHGIIFGK